MNQNDVPLLICARKPFAFVKYSHRPSKLKKGCFHKRLITLHTDWPSLGWFRFYTLNNTLQYQKHMDTVHHLSKALSDPTQPWGLIANRSYFRSVTACLSPLSTAFPATFTKQHIVPWLFIFSLYDR